MTPVEALTAGPVLAITAPTDEQSARAVELCERLAVGLSQDQVRQAQRAARQKMKTTKERGNEK